MNSFKALQEMVKNFQFNNAEQTREMQRAQLRINRELLKRITSLEARVGPRRLTTSPYDLSRGSRWRDSPPSRG